MVIDFATVKQKVLATPYQKRCKLLHFRLCLAHGSHIHMVNCRNSVDVW